MRYGFVRDIYTVVVAAPTVDNLESWYEAISATVDNYVSSRKTSFIDHMKDPDFKGYKHPAYIFEHADKAQQDLFINSNAIIVVSPGSAKDHHEDMIAEKRLALGYSDDDISDRRTLEEIHLSSEEGDRWDRRTDEQKAAAAAGKKQADDMRKRLGKAVTGSSFDPNPRGAVDDGTFNVRGISVDQGGSTSVIGTKRAGITTPQVSTDQMVEDQQETAVDSSLSDEEFVEQQVQRMTNALNPLANDDAADDDYDEWIASAEAALKSGDITREKLVAGVTAHIVNKLINRALQPVEGVTEVDEAMEVINGRLGQIAELTDERRKQISEAAYKNLTAPKPKPGDYKFAQNAKLTEASSMRGAGTPIFHFEVNKEGPNAGKFSVNEGSILIEAYGLSIVSNGLFAYEVAKDDPAYQADIRQYLIDAGFIEDVFILPIAAQPKMATSKTTIKPSDFAKAFAGNGTSAVDGTGSFGKHQLGKSEEDYINEMKPGLVGDKGITVDVDALLAKKKWADLDQRLRTALEGVLGDQTPEEILTGRYAGIQIGDGNYIIPIGSEEVVIDEACVNIRHLGSIRAVDGSSSFACARDQRGAYGFVMVRNTKTNQHKLYQIA